ncbi:MAG TPA: hypothetical protein VMT32_04485, partial [Bryobacteraceae bacterium]|nr:hypothetical protein [Bryobacteraceae bacterium]
DSTTRDYHGSFDPQGQSMSFNYSYIAIRCDVHELQAALLASWPELALAEPAQEFASWDSAYQWAVPRCGYLRGTHPNDVVPVSGCRLVNSGRDLSVHVL